MNKIFTVLFSMRTMVVLMLIFAIASAVATFIENDYGSETAKTLVYNAKWFELIMVLLCVNLSINIFRFRLYRKGKFTSLIFHLSLIFILFGAGITRYVGFEGIMHIRQGQTTDQILSADSFVHVNAIKNKKHYSLEHKILISSMTSNNFTQTLNIDEDELKIEYKDFIKNAQKSLVNDPYGTPSISLVVTTKHGPKTILLQEGKTIDIDGIIFDFGKNSLALKPKILFFVDEDNKIKIKSKVPLDWYAMNESKEGHFEAESVNKFNTSTVYTVGDIRFVPKTISLKAKIKITNKEKSKAVLKSAGEFSALILNLSYKGESKEIGLFGRGLGSKGFEEILEIGDLNIALEWGSKVVTLPFSIKLNKFIMKRYEGSNSPSSYESSVTLIDGDLKKEHKIYMNNVLNHKGYRFFQSSYDMDEKGTILSVNQDPGKLPTYIGYFLLTIGLFLNMFNPKSRFRKLTTSQIKANSLSYLLLGLLVIFGTNIKADQASDVLYTIKSIDKSHADNFGTILIQSSDGRIKPLDTISREVLNKVSRTNSILGLTPNQILLGMISKPSQWQKIKMVKYSHPKIKALLSIDSKKFSFRDAFDYTQKKPYKLFYQVEEANQKKPANRDQFDKDVLKIDERLNVLYMAYSAKLLKVFPRELKAWGSKDNGWLDMESAVKSSKQVDELLGNYLGAINHGINKGDWSYADEIVNEIKAYQKKYAKNITIDESRIKAELLFNRLQIFERLTPLYLLAGLIMLILTFAKLIKPKLNITIFTKLTLITLSFGFIVHSYGLGLRWYISGHAPWSDGYESMIYIAWAIILAGILFSRHSILALSTTGILAGVTLFTAHLSWMDPQITNLVPVLKSYWLTIHVSVITASYGFLALSAFLGFITMLFFILHSKDISVVEPIKEASRINEMSMIIGLSLLVVGNFIGGIWANESWGRYWGWDPKETWALVSIIIYSTVIHLRFIPKLNTLYAFALTSTIAFSSVIMTYFGVNYYLSGMHSYAAGDPMPIPSFAYYSVAIVIIIGILAYIQYKKHSDEF